MSQAGRRIEQSLRSVHVEVMIVEGRANQGTVGVAWSGRTCIPDAVRIARVFIQGDISALPAESPELATKHDHQQNKRHQTSRDQQVGGVAEVFAAEAHGPFSESLSWLGGCLVDGRDQVAWHGGGARSVGKAIHGQTTHTVRPTSSPSKPRSLEGRIGAQPGRPPAQRALAAVALAALTATCTTAQAQASSDLNAQEIHRILDSAALKAQADQIAKNNARLIGSIPTPSVTPTEPAPGRPLAPLANQVQRLGTFVGQDLAQLRNGRHNVVSADGEETVLHIRTCVTGAASTRQTACTELKQRAARQEPEALAFMGWIVELGLLGQKADARLAQRYYQAAAARQYQPALYNLALQTGYGRTGPADLRAAQRLMERATEQGADYSLRVCGMGSYIAYRAGDQASAMRFADQCPSALTSLARAKARPIASDPKLVDDLRQSIGAGADDAYGALVELGRTNIRTDRQLLYCKYRLLDQYRASPTSEMNGPVFEQAVRRCTDEARPYLPKDMAAGIAGEQMALSLATFVRTERTALQVMRNSNRYHWGRSVPFLPFSATDAEAFETALTAAGEKR